MNKKIYFAGSIRGGRVDANLYKEIIEYMKKDNIVLTENVGSNISQTEQGIKDTQIYLQDTRWIKESDLIIAECTCPSLGVGYELAYAERFKKPCYIFYSKSQCQLSAMLKGNEYFKIYPYETKEDMLNTVKFLNNLKVDAVKIHMLHILKGTEIEKLYNKEKFHILTKEEYIDIVINQLELLDEKIVIERITGDPIKDDLIAPLWLTKKFCLLNDIDKEMVKRNTYQGKKNNN